MDNYKSDLLPKLKYPRIKDFYLSSLSKSEGVISSVIGIALLLAENNSDDELDFGFFYTEQYQVLREKYLKIIDESIRELSTFLDIYFGSLYNLVFDNKDKLIYPFKRYSER